jgi:hypothetical protein
MAPFFVKSVEWPSVVIVGGDADGISCRMKIGEVSKMQQGRVGWELVVKTIFRAVVPA